MLTLFQSSNKTFKGKFIKIKKSDQNPDLLEGFPLYWLFHPQFQPSRSTDELESGELNNCKKTQ